MVGIQCESKSHIDQK